MSNDTPRQSPPFFLERASFWVTNLLYLGAFSCLGGLVERERGLLIGSLVTMIIGYVPVGWLLMDRGARRNPPREGAVRAAILVFGLLPLWLIERLSGGPSNYAALATAVAATVAAMLLALLAAVLVPPLRAGAARTATLLGASAAGISLVIAYVMAVRRFAPAPDPTPSQARLELVIAMAALASILLACIAVRLAIAAFRPATAPGAPLESGSS